MVPGSSTSRASAIGSQSPTPFDHANPEPTQNEGLPPGCGCRKARTAEMPGAHGITKDMGGFDAQMVDERGRVRGAILARHIVRFVVALLDWPCPRLSMANDIGSRTSLSVLIQPGLTQLIAHRRRKAVNQQDPRRRVFGSRTVEIGQVEAVIGGRFAWRTSLRRVRSIGASYFIDAWIAAAGGLVRCRSLARCRP